MESVSDKPRQAPFSRPTRRGYRRFRVAEAGETFLSNTLGYFRGMIASKYAELDASHLIFNGKEFLTGNDLQTLREIGLGVGSEVFISRRQVQQLRDTVDQGRVEAPSEAIESHVEQHKQQTADLNGSIEMYSDSLTASADFSASSWPQQQAAYTPSQILAISSKRKVEPESPMPGKNNTKSKLFHFYQQGFRAGVQPSRAESRRLDLESGGKTIEGIEGARSTVLAAVTTPIASTPTHASAWKLHSCPSGAHIEPEGPSCDNAEPASQASTPVKGFDQEPPRAGKWRMNEGEAASTVHGQEGQSLSAVHAPQRQQTKGASLAASDSIGALASTLGASGLVGAATFAASRLVGATAHVASTTSRDHQPHQALPGMQADPGTSLSVASRREVFGSTGAVTPRILTPAILEKKKTSLADFTDIPHLFLRLDTPEARSRAGPGWHVFTTLQSIDEEGPGASKCRSNLWARVTAKFARSIGSAESLLSEQGIQPDDDDSIVFVPVLCRVPKIVEARLVTRDVLLGNTKPESQRNSPYIEERQISNVPTGPVSSLQSSGVMEVSPTQGGASSLPETHQSSSYAGIEPLALFSGRGNIGAVGSRGSATDGAGTASYGPASSPASRLGASMPGSMSALPLPFSATNLESSDTVMSRSKPLEMLPLHIDPQLGSSSVDSRAHSAGAQESLTRKAGAERLDSIQSSGAASDGGNGAVMSAIDGKHLTRPSQMSADHTPRAADGTGTSAHGKDSDPASDSEQGYIRVQTPRGDKKRRGDGTELDSQRRDSRVRFDKKFLKSPVDSPMST